ncbi:MULTISPECIES: DUF1289 domain-containing protein [unclassified Bosea (in: a-proteobacteria)]|uniref:DUF1289 domain-containing protein n=1 Tax=unclassified Bosea (in: a-proteobacteria) TaxID=2653178 RepID=UPI001FCCE48D|nr:MULTISPECIES: DUF1289 domain-containing protein [unclassified Bosea (in: a-proteobacteria)]
MSTVSTPCIRVCVIDPVSQLCEGCGRTLTEIAQWAGLSEAQRLAIMAALPERLAGKSSESPAIRHARG